MTGALHGIRVVEFAGLGAAPFAGMMLADMGADVLLVDRPVDPQLGLERARWYDTMLRGRRSITLDLKAPDSVVAALQMVRKADIVLEGFRPGVMERLGLGPDVLLAANPKLVVGRMTGWGQDGPLAPRAGHDINYIAMSGVLHGIGRVGGAPVPPLNLVGDFGGGGMLLAFGVVCAIAEAQRSGVGQVVDAAMVEGASLLSTMFWGMQAGGKWSDARGENILDTGAPWYDVYETLDHKFVAIGAIEPKFYVELLERMGLANATLPAQHERAQWPELRRRFAQVFAAKTRADWCGIFAGSDACFSPVLTFAEARDHPHNVARHGHVKLGTIDQPAPAPRFSRTPGAARHAPPERGAHGAEALADWGFTDADIDRLRVQGVGFMR
jgi:alpha-methylacyl-CoA racemase